MPKTEEKLQEILGDRYKADDWLPAFNAVFAAEEDECAALLAIQQLEKESMMTAEAEVGDSTPDRGSKESSKLPREQNCRAQVPQLAELECELDAVVDDLHARRRIIGARPTIEDLLNPIDEIQVGAREYAFPGGDEEIIARALEGSDEGTVTDDEGNEEEEEEETEEISLAEGIRVCERLEHLCGLHSDDPKIDTLELQTQLRRLRGHLRKVEFASRKQTKLTDIWGKDV
ncbi:hypothetical protein K474DRAFT_1706766 [Panus rudis PR-1116 ss-1]|nr:hypothetical protein K474DRAFT_1706766 [Panus rudis PR-1116 ss-1]